MFRLQKPTCVLGHSGSDDRSSRVVIRRVDNTGSGDWWVFWRIAAGRRYPRATIRAVSRQTGPRRIVERVDEMRIRTSVAPPGGPPGGPSAFFPLFRVRLSSAGSSCGCTLFRLAWLSANMFCAVQTHGLSQRVTGLCADKGDRGSTECEGLRGLDSVGIHTGRPITS